MLNSYLSDALGKQRQTVEQLKTTDTVGAVLTLTRSAALAITTAGTIITWQSALRQYQIDWATTTITIPEEGWYAMRIALTFSVNLNNCLVVVVRNGVLVTSYNLFGDVDRNANTVAMLEYFTAGDAVQIRIFPSVNCNINVVGEGGNAESPILHIVQLSGGVDV